MSFSAFCKPEYKEQQAIQFSLYGISNVLSGKLGFDPYKLFERQLLNFCKKSFVRLACKFREKIITYS